MTTPLKPCPIPDCNAPAREGDPDLWEEKGRVTCSDRGEFQGIPNAPGCPMAGVAEETKPQWIRRDIWQLLPRWPRGGHHA